MWKNRNPNSAQSEPRDRADGASVCQFACGLDPGRDDYASSVVQRMLAAAIAHGVSDVHCDAAAEGTLVRWRVDGALIDLGYVPHGKHTSLVNRLKALANLLTYRSDIPQEGRLALSTASAARRVGRGGEMNPEIRPEPDARVDSASPSRATDLSAPFEARVVTLPTLFGERVVIRLAAQPGKSWLPADLGLPPACLDRLERALHAASGVILATGPAGSGKTTTVYACLRALTKQREMVRSIVSLEDPIEIAIPGVAQSQVQPSVGYDWALGLKALLRQDPEVMLVGEIRDAETAQVVFQAAMTGQLVLSTMHATGACDAVSRLLDMKVPAHQIRSTLTLLLCQRLVRRLCDCRAPAEAAMTSGAQAQDPYSQEPFTPRGCEPCGWTGYRGRLLLAEALPPIEERLARAIADLADTHRLKEISEKLGMAMFDREIVSAISSGLTTAAEVQRHFVQ